MSQTEYFNTGPTKHSKDLTKLEGNKSLEMNYQDKT